MEKLNPWKFGAVLSLTVLINYSTDVTLRPRHSQ